MLTLANPSGNPSPPYRTNEERWGAVLERDKKADGQFYFSVDTTGVFCRPSCAARRPRREHVQFHETSEAAKRAGFRACKRCCPDQPLKAEQHEGLIAEACRSLEGAQYSPNFADLAQTAGMSRFHFGRVFKVVTGVTPRTYFQACRMRRMQSELNRSKTITEAIYDSGFNSNGRFYAGSVQALGMKPKTFRARGMSTTIRFAVGECSLGSILVAATEVGICSILLGDDPERLVNDLEERFSQANLIGGEKEFEQWVARVVGFVEDPRKGLDLPLDVQGTAFQQRVWQALQEIPAGTTLSYQEIAQRIGAGSGVRAVAGACAANPVAIAIPCHRVVRKDGGLSGYRWGVERKRAILQREAESLGEPNASRH